MSNVCNHKWKYDGHGGGHNGEYTHNCVKCGASEWFAEPLPAPLAFVRAEQPLKSSDWKAIASRACFIDAIDVLSTEMAESAASKGFVIGWENVPEKIALIHSELSEALEAHRNSENEGCAGFKLEPSSHIPAFSNLVEEFADACIRIMSLCAALKLPLAEAIIAKMEYNKSRPHKHGGKKY